MNRSKRPVKLLELLAAGLPVVASAVGQNAEVIVDGQSGLLVACRARRRRLRRGGERPAGRRRSAGALWAAGAQARVREQFRWSLLLPKVLACTGASDHEAIADPRYLPPLAWMALIYGFSDRPDSPQVGVGWQDFVVKKFQHALAYAPLFRFWLWPRPLRGAGLADR
ncbi:MAG: glycosyltransferase [Ardenticatenia bacterium]|nr:glycosyltransferase [Ardenticatenia bacterium]